MPILVKNTCSYPRCTNAVDSGYCDKHKKESPSRKKKVHPWYNLSIKEAERLGFNTNWKGNPNKPLGQRGGSREEQLMKEPACRHCKQEGKTVAAEMVDHITPWKTGNTEEERKRLFEDKDNLQSLCNHHHTIKTRKEDAQRKQSA